MKNLVLGLAFVFGLLASVFCAIVAYDVWYAGRHAPVVTPGAVEQGRMALHAQLAQATQQEEQAEKLYWNSPGQLQILIQRHQQRIDALAGNTASGEIVAHDQQAMARLQQRIDDLAAQAMAADQAMKDEAAANRLASQ